MKMAARRARKRAGRVYVRKRAFRGKGPISVALVVTQHARNMGLPLDDEKLITEGGGQVLGLGKGAVRRFSNDMASIGAGFRRRTDFRAAACTTCDSNVAFLTGSRARRSSIWASVEAFWTTGFTNSSPASRSRLSSTPRKSPSHGRARCHRQAEERQKTRRHVLRRSGLQHWSVRSSIALLGTGSSSTTVSRRRILLGLRAGDFFLGGGAILSQPHPAKR